MAEILDYLFSAAAIWLWLLAALVIAAIVYARHDSFFLTDLTYRLPVVGKLSRFSRDYAETKRGEWLNGEAVLCHDYARHVTALSPEAFGRNLEYLKASFDHGRRPMPMWVLGLLIVLVILEGLGFSYLLGSWMAIESSENQRMLLTAAIVVVLAAILVWVTHSAGHQLYRTRLLRSCFQHFQANAIVTTPDGKKPEPRVFTSQIIDLSDDQYADSDMPPHVRCANRVVSRPDDLGSYAWVWTAAVLVAVIATISLVLRIETMYSNDLLAAQFMPSAFEDAAAQANREEAEAARAYAAFASFTILATIFVVTQLVGMGVGYWYGFASKQGRKAYDATQGCADYDTYFRPIRRRMNIADLRLTTLHQKLESRLPYDIDWKWDFFNFIDQERERGATDLQNPARIDAAAIEAHNRRLPCRDERDAGPAHRKPPGDESPEPPGAPR